jgi:CspA family cold shock protein
LRYSPLEQQRERSILRTATFAGPCFRLKEQMHMVGTVKWFNNSKGYGFITAEDGQEVFVHHSEIRAEGYRTLDEGSRVEFELKQGPKGLAATNVVPVR